MWRNSRSNIGKVAVLGCINYCEHIFMSVTGLIPPRQIVSMSIIGRGPDTPIAWKEIPYNFFYPRKSGIYSSEVFVGPFEIKKKKGRSLRSIDRRCRKCKFLWMHHLWRSSVGKDYLSVSYYRWNSLMTECYKHKTNFIDLFGKGFPFPCFCYFALFPDSHSAINMSQ